MSVTNGVPLGIRLNNPLNIKRSGASWAGKSAVQSHPVFETFDSAYYGIRAAARILINYGRIHKLDTLAEIIHRWAPPDDDNDTGGYVDFVADKLDVKPDTSLNLEDEDVLTALVKAMMHMEIGSVPYSDGVIRSAVAAAKVGAKPGVPVVVPDDFPTPAPAPQPTPQPAPTPPPASPQPLPTPPAPVPVPNTGWPPLVVQPTSDVQNKVKAATAGAVASYPVAWFAVVLWNQYGPPEPMPFEVAFAIQSAAAGLFAYVAGYYTRNRAAPPFQG